MTVVLRVHRTATLDVLGHSSISNLHEFVTHLSKQVSFGCRCHFADCRNVVRDRDLRSIFSSEEMHG